MEQLRSRIHDARLDFHARLVTQGPLTIQEEKVKGGIEKVASNADKSQRTSREIALFIAEELGAQIHQKGPGQSAGNYFEQEVKRFLEDTLPGLGHLLVGEIQVQNFGSSRRVDHMAKFWPYLHLDELETAIIRNPELRAVLGNSYSISPDVVVTRKAFPDHQINQHGLIVDDQIAQLTPAREQNCKKRYRGEAPEIVHAVVSCKWTMRSDRSQNSRSEALNLIRNRKGRAPHIVAVTAEPSPSRLASLALGTGDIDMLYHFALPELKAAVEATDNSEAIEMLGHLIEGNRVRDITDLPLDLLL